MRCALVNRAILVSGYSHASLAIGVLLVAAGAAGCGTLPKSQPLAGATVRDLRIDWMTWNERQKKNFFDAIGKAIESDDNSIAGALGGMGRLSVPNGTGGQWGLWKTVEALDGAQDVDITRMTTPTVVAVIRGTRGKGAATDVTVIQKGATAYLVLYPDRFTEGGGNGTFVPVIDEAADKQAALRVVTRKGSDITISRPIANGVVRCLRKDAQGNDVEWPKKDYAYAKFETCNTANVSPETIAHFLGLTIGDAKTIRGNLSGVEQKALDDLIDNAAARLQATQPAVYNDTTARNKELLRVWTDAGVWFSCALGCCYANTLQM